MSVGALVLPVDMEVYSLSSSPVLSSSPRLGADFLSTSPLLGADFLSDLHRPGRQGAWTEQRAWAEPRPNLFSRIACQRRPPTPPSDDDQEEEEEEEDEEEEAERPRSILRREEREEDRRDDKKVVFADDKGLPLVQVRWMREPSHLPPRWTARFFRHVTGKQLAPAASQRPRFALDFPQPAADYTRFCERLDAGSVALEHAMYRDTDEKVTGTVKVKNLHFEKEVFVRVSEDNWRTHRDVPAKYVPPGGGGGGACLYDRFSFELPLAARVNRLEFCVCFRCPAGEFWDSNGGSNYSVSRVKSSPARSGPPRDIYHEHVANWSCFSSWGDEFGGGPYY